MSKKTYLICEDLTQIFLRFSLLKNKNNLLKEAVYHIEKCDICTLKQLKKEYPIIEFYINNLKKE